MKNGKEKGLDEIRVDLLEEVGGGYKDPSAPTQTVINGTANANANGNYNYTLGVTVTVSPSPTQAISIGAGVGGNNNQPVDNISLNGSYTF
jgi:hypothetical protein